MRSQASPASVSASVKWGSWSCPMGLFYEDLDLCLPYTSKKCSSEITVVIHVMTVVTRIRL